MTLGVDVGGTFTDFAYWDGNRVRVLKAPTTADQSDAVISGAQRVLAGEHPRSILHGTTVATNAVLERAGARVALIATKGMGDVLEIGRQDRPSLYDPMADRPEPLVPRSLRFGAPGRLAGDGSELEASSGFGDLIDAVAAARPKAVAICLLYGYAYPAREERVASALRGRLGAIPISLSSQVAPEFREFERTSTTVLNAYLMPVVGQYLRSLAGRAARSGLGQDILVMRSSGGLMSIGAATERPAAVLLSGPAGGVVAAAAAGGAAGRERIISFDMGGTSTDVCRIEGGRPTITYERSVDGLPCRLPAINVHTVGAGGGSIAWADAGGALRVGPVSAGADPGPACYGRGGTDPTVTDAHVVLGHIASNAALGGVVGLRPDLAKSALRGLAEVVGLSLDELALGIVRVANSHMERAIKTVSVEEGADTRDAVLVAFGGAGGLHATALARRFEMSSVLVPPHAGVFSALGQLLSPARTDVARSLADNQPGIDGVLDAASSVLDEARDEIQLMGFEADRLDMFADVRYRGQSHETVVPLHPTDRSESLEERFHRAHERRNGFSRPGDPIEIVTVRAEASARPRLGWRQIDWRPDPSEPKRGSRPILTGDGTVEASVLWRPALAPGEEALGPAVLEETEATTLVATGERGLVLDDGSLEISW